MDATAAAGMAVVTIMAAAGVEAEVSGSGSIPASTVTPDTTMTITMIVRATAITAIGTTGMIAIGANTLPRPERPGLLMRPMV